GENGLPPISTYPYSSSVSQRLRGEFFWGPPHEGRLKRGGKAGTLSTPMERRASRKKMRAGRARAGHAGAALFLVLLTGATWIRWTALASAGPIEADVRDLVSKHGFDGSRVGVAVISQGGKQVVALNDREPFQPASNQKVLTTAAALYWLGLDHEFETT